MSSKIILGLIGRIGSGKTVAADYLVRKYGVGYLRFSDVLRDILQRIHKPDTRENLQNLGIALRKCFGEGVLAGVLRKDILASTREVIVVDGVRYEDEVQMIKDVGGKIVYVTAPQELRFERTVGRGTRGESGLTFQQFRENENRETEKMIDVLGERAEYRIDNTGTVEDLKRKVDAIVKNVRKN